MQVMAECAQILMHGGVLNETEHREAARTRPADACAHLYNSFAGVWPAPPASRRGHARLRLATPTLPAPQLVEEHCATRRGA